MITLEENINVLERIRYEIATLRQYQEDVERVILEQTGRAEFKKENGQFIITNISKEGRDTQAYGKYKLIITTNYNYNIDKEEYQVYKNQIPKGFDPVREVIKLDVNKSIMRDVQKYGCPADELLLSKFIKRDYAKPSVSFELNTKG